MIDIDPKGAMHSPGAQLELLCEAGRRLELLIAVAADHPVARAFEETLTHECFSNDTSAAGMV